MLPEFSMKSIKKRDLLIIWYDGDTRVHFTFACDVMMDLGGSIRPAMYLANELISRGHKISIMSPLMSEMVEEGLRENNIEPINLHAKLVAKNLGQFAIMAGVVGDERLF